MGGEPPELSGAPPATGFDGFVGFGHSTGIGGGSEGRGERDVGMNGHGVTHSPGPSEDVDAYSADSEFELQCAWFDESRSAQATMVRAFK